MAASGRIMSSESPFYHIPVASACSQFTFTNQTDVVVHAPHGLRVCYAAFIRVGRRGTAMQISHIIKPNTDPGWPTGSGQAEPIWPIGFHCKTPNFTPRIPKQFGKRQNAE